jgi:hypothetical protein
MRGSTSSGCGYGVVFKSLLRTVVLGRKNYLFAGSNRGGERAAAIYSLIGTAKLNGVDPEAYLRNVLSRIADHPIIPSTALLTCSPGTTFQLPGRINESTSRNRLFPAKK